MDIQNIIQSNNFDTERLRSAIHQLVQSSAAIFDSSNWQPERADEFRKRILNEIIFRGVPSDWRKHQTKIEWIDIIESDSGYQIQKLRLEILPDFWIPALLYQPNTSKFKEPLPAMLSVNGHIGPLGKSIEFVQRRCINLAKRGILTLHLEWLSFGELSAPNYTHNRLAYLDLCGVSGLSVFYLAMRGGLDLLWEHSFVDKERIAMTGLSGGGWQTIVLSALDTRIALSVPNAGYIDISNRLSHVGDIGDLEQNPTDLLTLADYTHLTALLFPRPALLIYNHQDDCCFVADRAKPAIYDAVKSIYSTDSSAIFAFYKNVDPGTHNYDQDNRQQLYRFLSHHFHIPIIQDKDMELENEILSSDTLVVGLPDKVANFKTLTTKIIKQQHQMVSKSPEKLKSILRFQPTSVHQVEPASIEGQSGQFIFDNDLSASFCRFEPETNTTNETVILITDQGVSSMFTEIDEQVKVGKSVLAVDLFLTGQATPAGMSVSHTVMLLSTVGLRALGLQVSQLIAIIDWNFQQYSPERISLLSKGWTTSIVAQLTKELCFDRIKNHIALNPLIRLRNLIDKEVEYEQYPTLFCFGLLQHIDGTSFRN